MTSRASAVVTPLASSEDGTDNTAPAFSRFMFSPMNALGLLRNNATSIWSSDTPARWLWRAMRYSVSPSRTLYSSGPVGNAAAGAAGARLVCTAPREAGAGRGAGAAAVGGIGVGATVDGVGAGAAAGGAADTCGAAGAWACTGGATRDCGGSSSSVNSRTRRPDDHVSSRITSTNGSCTARSLVTRRYGLPSGRRAIVTCVEGSTAL